MAYWDNLSLYNGYQVYQPGRPRSSAYAAQSPVYEQQTPQYISPNAYSLAQQGFATNTLVYACINKRMSAISQAPLGLFNKAHEIPTRIYNNKIFNILQAPNERINEQGFWEITSVYSDIAGFAAWEIERNNAGDPMQLWPMRPDWCSFMRGAGRPLRCVRYQPYGLPPQDINIDNIILFQNFDPRFPLLKSYSPTMAALKDIGVDNGMSEFLYSFIKQGAQFSGLLTTDQDLDDIEAERIKQRWKVQHGGVENWNDIAVLGRGATYQNTSMSFNDMAFPDLDGRIEARLCMAFEIPPMLLGAKVGLNASTFSNYESARKAWYEEWVTPKWKRLSGATCTQLLREPTETGYTINPHFECKFITDEVSALQENRDLQFRRAISAARANVLTRDEARAEIRVGPIDNAPVFVGPVARLDSNSPTGANDDEIANQTMGEDDAMGQDDPLGSDPAIANETASAASQAEKKQFRAFASKRIKEGKPADVLSFQWKFTQPAEALSFMQEVVNGRS